MLKLASDVPAESIVNYVLRRREVCRGKLATAENESDLRHHFLTVFDLDMIGFLELYRVDYASPALWLEVKYRLDIRDLNSRCSVIAQMLHYVYKAIADRGEEILPKSFGIVDRKYLMLYDTADFGKYFFNPSYFKDIQSPSAAHPELEKALRTDPIVTSRPMHIVAEYGRIWDELNSRGIYG